MLRKLQTVQHAAASLVLKLPRHSSASADLKTLHWLKIHKRVLFQILLITFRAFRASVRKYFISRFTPMLLLAHSDLLQQTCLNLLPLGARQKVVNSLPSSGLEHGIFFPAISDPLNQNFFLKIAENLDLCSP